MNQGWGREDSGGNMAGLRSPGRRRWTWAAPLAERGFGGRAATISLSLTVYNVFLNGHKSAGRSRPQYDCPVITHAMHIFYFFYV